MLAILVAWLALFAPQSVPSNDGWVTDRAGLLSAGEEQTLEEDLEAFRQKTGHELALLTVPNLAGGSIENLALETSRAWKMGRKDVSDAALLVIAKEDREMRIEVGRGLEGELTDLECGRIIREEIVPRFRTGDFYAGIRAGLDAMKAATAPGFAGLPASALARARKQAIERLVKIVVVLLFFVFAIISGIHRRRHGPQPLGGGLAPFGLGMLLGSLGRSSGRGSGGGFGGGGFGGFGGGGGFSGGGASGRW
ncbi:MAG: TPM domain-containing protein [Planctomycetes bacterium]|nr:TPM domain-containing protein [Planctomycetota bacterium]